MKKTSTWALFGTVAINIALGCAIALLFTASPAVQAAEQPSKPQHGPAPPPKQDTKKQDYLTAVRMGWAAG